MLSRTCVWSTMIISSFWLHVILALALSHTDLSVLCLLHFYGKGKCKLKEQYLIYCLGSLKRYGMNIEFSNSRSYSTTLPIHLGSFPLAHLIRFAHNIPPPTLPLSPPFTCTVGLCPTPPFLILLYTGNLLFSLPVLLRDSTWNVKYSLTHWAHPPFLFVVEHDKVLVLTLPNKSGMQKLNAGLIYENYGT